MQTSACFYERFRFILFKKSHVGMDGFVFRAQASSLCGHIVDTVIFSIVAFLGVIPTNALPGMIMVGVILKWGYEWLAIPLTVRVTKWVLAKEEML